MAPVKREQNEQGVTDVVRLSNARLSGTAFGTIILHVAPESAMVRYAAGGQDCVLFGHPSDPMRRERLVVRVSCDGAQSWTRHRLIDPGKVSYSDLVVVPDKMIDLVYGKRVNEGVHSGALSSSAVFVRFDFAWLMQDKGKGK